VSKLATRLSAAFAEAGLRPTPQRYAVLEFLARRPVHATAEEIFHAVNRKDPRSSRATVYNSLRSLAHAGLVREVASDGKAARFDTNLNPHHHFVCDSCLAVEDIGWIDLPESARPGRLGSHVVRNYDIVFRGLCERCRRPRREAGER
jgi:Fur family transcriptional regulator, peroxide stress response regulator